MDGPNYGISARKRHLSPSLGRCRGGEYAQGCLLVGFGAQLVVAEVADQNAEEPLGRCRVGNVAEHGTK